MGYEHGLADVLRQELRACWACCQHAWLSVRTPRSRPNQRSSRCGLRGGTPRSPSGIRLAPQPQCTRAAPRLGGRWVRRYGWPPRFCDGAPQPADKELRQVASCTEPVVAGRWQGEPERRSASAESRRGRRVSRAAGAGRVLPGRRASASTASLRSGPAGRARAGGRCARRWPAPAACRRPCACDCRRRPCV